ncbi:MAG TPA: sensor domain-containing diguanylate cyclase [Candidatus Hydrogenedentes bacterium]|nr:sensor domain-containing diguanylate cyclase [Candidatus Hydrogenedentota bacterium]
MADTQDTQSLLSRLAAPHPEMDFGHDPFVPIDDYAAFRMIAGEIARTGLAQRGKNVTVVVDGHTAARVDAIEELRLSAAKVWHYGQAPAAWARAENVVELPTGHGFGDDDRLLAVIADQVALLTLGTHHEGTESEIGWFQGAWTAHRDAVTRVLAALPGCEAELVPARSADAATSIALRLMAIQTSLLASRHRDIAMDKDDLFAVLNILKAMSAKRSAHDILYVFVEHIARVVTADRCSIVRIWGGEPFGQVLASHEDANLINHTIDLAKYPELGHVLQTAEKTIINDVRTHPLTKPCLEDLERANIRSLLVIPIVLYDRNVGSLILRAARSQGTFTLRETSFFEIVAEAASNALERAELFERVQKANERLEVLAVTDGLTGIFNHRCFRNRLAEEVDRALRYRIPLACMIFDVDNFKQINDAHGHLVGDGILCEIAKRTSRTVRRSDIVARYGGEEFVVIMPQTGADGAAAQAERVRAEIASRPFEGVPGGIPVTVSVGVGVLDHDAAMDCEGLIVQADRALYEAKRTGKNRVALAG